MTQQFCLKWNNHMVNMVQVFESLLSTEALVDCTLACDGNSLKAHKMVLSACSPFFLKLFSDNPCKHPIVIMKDMRHTDLKAIIDFMYRGEVNVSHDQLSALLKTAETLQVKGLAEVTGDKCNASGIVQQEVVQPPPLTSATALQPTPLTNSSVQRTDTPPLQGKRKRGRPRKRSLSDSNRSDDEGVSSKMRHDRDSPELEELSADTSMDATSDSRLGGGVSSNSHSQVHSSSNAVHVNNFSKSHLSVSRDSLDDQPSGDENDFEVEPSKLLEQTLTTDNVPSSSQNCTGNANLPSASGDGSRRSMSSTDSLSQALVPVSDSLGSNLQGPDSPQDVKPCLAFDDAPVSPVAGTSHGIGSMIYMDQSGVPSLAGPSNYQDNALVPHDSQPQGIKILPPTLKNGSDGKSVGKIILPLTLSRMPQLFLINSNVLQRREIQLINEPAVKNVAPEIKKEDIDSESTSANGARARIISYETPLPEFSESVYRHLQENNLSAVWGTFVDECAKYYYEQFPDIQNSSEYQAIGRKMYATYPSIGYEGKEPWSFFCKSLSQKIRHIKWKVKRKRLGISSRRPIRRKDLKFRSLKKKIDRRYTPSKQYKALLRELTLGWANNTITENRIIDIIKATSNGRRVWLTSVTNRKISSLINEYPCFAEGKYVINDFLHLMKIEEMSDLLQKMESLFSAVGAVMDPPTENLDLVQNLAILRYMEDETAFHKTKAYSKSIVIHKTNVKEEDMMKLMEGLENSSPILYVFSNGTDIQKAYVAGDKIIISTNTTVFYEALITLIAAYYTFSIEYPKSFSQILGLLQTYVVGESYDGIKSNRCSTFIKNLTSNFVLGE